MDTFKYSYKNEKENTIMMNIYNCGYQKCEAKFCVGPRYINSYLIHHVVSGKGYCSINYIDKKHKSQTNNAPVEDKVFEIKSGDTFIMYPDSIVTYFADDKDPWEYYWVGFGGSDAKNLLAQTNFSKDNIVIESKNNYRLKDFLLNIYYSTGENTSNKIRMIGFLYLFLSEIIKISSKTKANTDISVEYVKKAVEYIRDNYSQKITVVDIANFLGVSRSHLYRVFVKNLEKTPKEYLDYYRIKQSLILLERTALTVNEVSNTVGYSDQLHFSKVFKKMMEVSPREYRKNCVQ